MTTATFQTFSLKRPAFREYREIACDVHVIWIKQKDTFHTAKFHGIIRINFSTTSIILFLFVIYSSEQVSKYSKVYSLKYFFKPAIGVTQSMNTNNIMYDISMKICGNGNTIKSAFSVDKTLSVLQFPVFLSNRLFDRVFSKSLWGYLYEIIISDLVNEVLSCSRDCNN